MMNPAMVAGGTVALAGALAWGLNGYRAMRRETRRLRESMTRAECVGLLRGFVTRELGRKGAHIEVSRKTVDDEESGVIYAARHYALVAGPETDESFAASRLAKRLTDPRYALPAPVLLAMPPRGRGRVTRDTLPRMRVPWSSVVGHVEGLPDEPHGRVSAQLRAIHHQREGVSA